MVQHIRAWLNALPIEDPIDRRQAVSLQIALFGLLATGLVGLTISSSTPGAVTRAISLLANASTLACTVAALVLVRRGAYRVAIGMAMGALLSGLTINLIVTGLGQVRGIVMIFALPIALAGLLLGRRALLVTTGLTVGIIAAVAVMERLDPPLAGLLTVSYPPAATISALVISVLLTAVCIDQFGVQLRHNLDDLRRANRQLAVELATRQRLEDQLIQAQKMEGIGRLAGGVAHDFNNLLVVINGYTEMAIEDLPPTSDAVEDLREVQRATQRAANLTGQLLTFARRQVSAPQQIDVGELLGEMEPLLRRLIREDITMVVVVQPGLWPVLIDPLQIERVVINLVVNARDAMPEGGRLVLETANVVLDESYAQQHVNIAAGDYVMLAVSDTGVGMGEEVLRHLFEPFFTTKAPGKGTGLGLATCYGIVRQHGGAIWVYSEPNQGTTVKVYLPRAVGQASEAPRREAPDELRGGYETVLLVEDEPAVRELAARVLRGYGYTVIEAPNGLAALQAMQSAEPPGVALLLTDIVMPQMGGRDLAGELTILHPGLRVLYTSGYTDNAVLHHSRLGPGEALLQKPFTPADLVRKVREVLDA